MRAHLLTLTAVLSLAANASSQQVWVVDRDGGAGVDFTSLSLAVDQAADGDVLLVRESTFDYGPVTVAGKGLTIVAEPEVEGARPVVATLLVRDLAPTQTVVVKGLAVEPPILALQPAVWVRECAGAVVLEDLDVAPDDALLGVLLAVQNAPRVVVTRVELTAPDASPYGATFPGVRGLSVAAASVALYDCRIDAGDGASVFVSPFDGSMTPAQDGGDGVVLSSGALLLAGCVVEGGDGGDGAFVLGACQPAGGGGDGVRVEGGALLVLDTTWTAGVAGTDAAGCPAAGAPGDDLDVVGGSVQTVADTLRRFEVDGPIHEGTAAMNTIEGVPGELVVLLVSLAPDGGIVPGLGGALLGGPPLLAIVLGAIPAGGLLAFQVPVAVGSLPPSIEGIDVHEQILVAGAHGFGLLGNPQVVTIVR